MPTETTAKCGRPKRTAANLPSLSIMIVIRPAALADVNAGLRLAAFRPYSWNADVRSVRRRRGESCRFLSRCPRPWARSGQFDPLEALAGWPSPPPDVEG